MLSIFLGLLLPEFERQIVLRPLEPFRHLGEAASFRRFLATFTGHMTAFTTEKAR
jgi:hypothetical protein